jgi:hypothetical protein
LVSANYNGFGPHAPSARLENGQDAPPNRAFHTNTKAETELSRHTIHLRRLSLLGNFGESAARKKFFQKSTAAQIATYYYTQFLYFEAPPAGGAYSI